jgi:hypothetical protein
MKKKIFCLVVIVSVVFSCKKTETNADSGSSELWVKLDDKVPDFTLSFQYGDVKNGLNIYTIFYKNQTFIPNLKVLTDSENGVYGNWIQVYKDFNRTEVIILQLSNGKVYKVKGFEFHEKRLIEIISVSGDTVNVVDRDISIIEKFIVIN